LIEPPTREELQREFDFVNDLVSYWTEKIDERSAMAKRARDYIKWVIRQRNYSEWRAFDAERQLDLCNKLLEEAERCWDYYYDWMISVRTWLQSYKLIEKSWPTILAQHGL
jgi:hypothetical protein